MTKSKNVLLVGVGGQGTILASKILSEGLIEHGYDVKMSEIHGMSQRGGHVSTQVRYGEKVNSPTIGKGEADVIVAFEKMEALRWISYLKEDGKMIINDYEIPSVPILMGATTYPEGIIEELDSKADIQVFKAGDIAESLGNSKVMNIVLLGATVAALGLKDINWENVIEKTVKKNFVSLNIDAFKEGIKQA